MNLFPPRIVLFHLIACYLALNGWMQVQAVGHTFQHVHHTATTHSSPLCSWYCAAGVAIQTSDVLSIDAIRPLTAVAFPVPSLHHHILILSPFSRGPPLIV